MITPRRQEQWNKSCSAADKEHRTLSEQQIAEITRQIIAGAQGNITESKLASRVASRMASKVASKVASRQQSKCGSPAEQDAPNSVPKGVPKTVQWNIPKPSLETVDEEPISPIDPYEFFLPTEEKFCYSPARRPGVVPDHRECVCPPGHTHAHSSGHSNGHSSGHSSGHSQQDLRIMFNDGKQFINAELPSMNSVFTFGNASCNFHITRR